jgi:ATP-dependent DNA helicase HFM1/MER3
MRWFRLTILATSASGVAFHHAGLDLHDRQVVESGFLNGNINVICCTSTLAVGVNLPCHLVIIKNTVAWQDDGLKEYADLELMQMLGRAGRYLLAAVCAVILRCSPY